MGKGMIDIFIVPLSTSSSNLVVSHFQNSEADMFSNATPV